MKKNLGSADKLIRLALAIVLIILFYKEILSGTIGLVALGVAFILTLTSLVSFCPLYAMLGLRTTRKVKEKD